MVLVQCDKDPNKHVAISRGRSSQVPAVQSTCGHGRGKVTMTS